MIQFCHQGLLSHNLHSHYTNHIFSATNNKEKTSVHINKMDQPSERSKSRYTLKTRPPPAAQNYWMNLRLSYNIF